jgi:hypothetical protein
MLNDRLHVIHPDPKGWNAPPPPPPEDERPPWRHAPLPWFGVAILLGSAALVLTLFGFLIRWIL